MFSRQFCNAIGQDNKKTIVSQKLANYLYASAVPRELCDKIPTHACHEMWSNGALFADETVQNLLLGKIFFQCIVIK